MQTEYAKSTNQAFFKEWEPVKPEDTPKVDSEMRLRHKTPYGDTHYPVSRVTDAFFFVKTHARYEMKFKKQATSILLPFPAPKNSVSEYILYRKKVEVSTTNPMKRILVK